MTSTIMSGLYHSRVYDTFEALGCYLAVALGIITWIILHYREARGDYALGLLAVSVTALFYVLQYTEIKGYLSLSSWFCTLLFTTIYVFTSILATVLYRLGPYHPLAAYPGPVLWSISNLFLSLKLFAGRAHYTVDDLHKKYGPFVRIGPNMICINSPSASTILNCPKLHMEKGESYRQPDSVPGVSLFFKQDRQVQAKRKRLWLKGLTASAINNYCTTVKNRLDQLTQLIAHKMEKDDVVDMANCIKLWAYDVMGDIAFGGFSGFEFMNNGDPDRLVQKGHEAMTFLVCFGHCRWLMDILLHLPVSESVYGIRPLAASMMRRRAEAQNVERVDLASCLLVQDKLTGEPLPTQDLELEAVVIIQASAGTIYLFLSFAVFFVTAHPQVYDRLRRELQDAFPEGFSSLSKDKLADILILDPVILETLRLVGPWFMTRVVPPGGVHIDDHFIPGHTTVVSPSFTQQTSEENFPFRPKLKEFYPERWIPKDQNSETLDDMKKQSAFVVQFSSGPYTCPGKNLAMMELRHAIACLFLTFDFNFPPSFDAQHFVENFKFNGQAFVDPALTVIAKRR